MTFQIFPKKSLKDITLSSDNYIGTYKLSEINIQEISENNVDIFVYINTDHITPLINLLKQKYGQQWFSHSDELNTQMDGLEKHYGWAYKDERGKYKHIYA